MAENNDDWAAYLLTRGATDSYVAYAGTLVDLPESGVHFVFRLVGAWDSLTVLEAPPEDLSAIRLRTMDLTAAREDGSRPLDVSVLLGFEDCRIKKRIAAKQREAIAAVRAQPGEARNVVAALRSGLPETDALQVQIDRVHGEYDVLCEIGADTFETIQAAVEDLRKIVGSRGEVHVAYATGLRLDEERSEPYGE